MPADPKIVSVSTSDLRFPTSRDRDGSDAMHPDPDYSAAYVVLDTDAEVAGHGLTFTIGRGNELCVAAIDILSRKLVGRRLGAVTEDWRGFWRELTGDSQLRWLGPEKGVIHLATAAVVNALWDLHARVEGKPLWRLLVDMTAEEIVRAIDFRYLTDVLTPEEALALLKHRESGRAERLATVLRDGYPAYTTSVGWLGYEDGKIRHLCREAVKQGFRAFKMKVGGDIDDDRRRAAIIRDEIGWERILMMDANQVWDVEEAITHMEALSEFRPLWIEEPTSPDDILGHAVIARALRPIGVATGEHCPNRVMFKQFLRAEAIQFCQIDACRLGGVNEVLAVLLLAAKFDVPVCPHAGGVGLCEHVQHLSLFDYVSVSASLDNRFIEYVDHLHEHFEDPVVVRDGSYRAPLAAGYSTAIKRASRDSFSYPNGRMWQGV
ncbi:MAG TPA: L-fuconate dehydratase [Vicinamibacteria bacterium]|nr:L-fuconate dehydratase [Vicinamibacteria bacterium]